MREWGNEPVEGITPCAITGPATQSEISSRKMMDFCHGLPIFFLSKKRIALNDVAHEQGLPEETLILTIDGFLVQGVHKVAGIFYGVFKIADGVCAATLTPQALLGRLGLVLQFTESGLLWTGHTKKSD